MGRVALEIADIFRQHGIDYRGNHPLPLNQIRAMRAIEICRTEALGGHVDRCDNCGNIKVSYNSCRNRHCPKCQFLQKEKWLEARKQDLLPIQYFHVVFTIPDELNPIALRNQKVIYNTLFQSVSEALMEIARDRKHLGAEIGFISILHTWGQNLMDHPHIHCIVTGGGLSNNGSRWVSCKKKFFLPVKVLSRLFRGKFLDYLKRNYDSAELKFPGGIAHLQETKAFGEFLKSLYNHEWVVYCKPPFRDAEGVLQYLGRYTHRVAISNDRIITIEDGKVSFQWRDYSDCSRNKVMTLNAFEFIRRFLLHVLPERFVKIRYYGLWGNRNRKALINQCRKLLRVINVIANNRGETWQEFLLKVCGIDITRCPVCKEGRMFTKEILQPIRCARAP